MASELLIARRESGAEVLLDTIQGVVVQPIDVLRSTTHEGWDQVFFAASEHTTSFSSFSGLLLEDQEGSL